MVNFEPYEVLSSNCSKNKALTLAYCENALTPRMLIALITHPACLEQDTGEGHPERPARLRAVIEALDGFELLPGDAPLATVARRPGSARL